MMPNREINERWVERDSIERERERERETAEEGKKIKPERKGGKKGSGWVLNCSIFVVANSYRKSLKRHCPI